MDRNPLNSQPTGQTGSATAMMLMALAGIMILFATALALLQVHIAASKAAVAADLAALSAADTARGLMLGDPCTLAEQTVHEHGGFLEACSISKPGVAYIQVRFPSPIGFDTTAESRAGPKLP